MAGHTKEQRAAKKAAQAEAEAQHQAQPEQQVAVVKKSAPVSDVGFVPMTKAGETIDVHPTCVKSHKAAGWKEV